MSDRCGSLCPMDGPPLACTLQPGHQGRHQAGHFGWFDPPRVFVGGQPYEPSAEPVRFSWERDRNPFTP